jgi:hypothetical protein
MTSSRLFIAALLLSALPVCAQDSPNGHRMAGQLPLFCFDPAATRSEPWRIVPDLPAKFRSGADLMEPLRSSARSVDSERPACRASVTDSADQTILSTRVSTTAGIPESAVLRSDSDLTCYTIRSYVVARDSKGSESTHPAGYSTCRPSDRYQVRTTEMRVVGER